MLLSLILLVLPSTSLRGYEQIVLPTVINGQSVVTTPPPSTIVGDIATFQFVEPVVTIVPNNVTIPLAISSASADSYAYPDVYNDLKAATSDFNDVFGLTW